VRLTFTPLVLFASVTLAPAADPKAESNEASQKYQTALHKTVELLAKVKDEATAAEAKPKLDTLHTEARDARKRMLKAFAEVDLSEGQLAEVLEGLPKGLRLISDKITAEFDRIANNHKAAYKVLRETKLFAGLETEYEGRAKAGATLLMTFAKTYTTRNDGTPPPNLEVLGTYSETGKKALTDPWGFPYQLATKLHKDGVNRLHIWTVSPYSGTKLGNPPPDEKDEKKDK
jgi:hypothetical protein